MTETVERETETPSYRTLTRDDVVDLRVERIRTLEREHMRLCLIAEENGGGLTGTQDAQRLDIEARIGHHTEIVWPGDSTPHTPAPDHPDGPDGLDEPGGDVPARPQRGALREAPTFDALGDLGPALRDEEHVHHAAHAEGDPVEDSPELPDGAPLGDARDDDDEDDGGGAARGAYPVEPFDYVREHGPSPLQRTSHFPSERDRPRHAD